MPNPDVVELLDRVPTRPFNAVGYRHLAEGRQPLSGEGARIHGGRWNPPESFPTLYVGMTEDVVAAEFRKLANRSNRSPSDFLPRELYEIEISLGTVLDLSDMSHVGAVGFTLEDLVADDVRPCQELGDAAHYLGIEAVLAPSAAGAGLALAIFTDRTEPASRLSSRLLRVWELPDEV